MRSSGPSVIATHRRWSRLAATGSGAASRFTPDNSNSLSRRPPLPPDTRGPRFRPAGRGVARAPDAEGRPPGGPIERAFAGWEADPGGLPRADQLPANAAPYIDALEELAGAPITLVSVGPELNQTIQREPRASTHAASRPRLAIA